VLCLDSAAKLVSRIELPVTRVSACAFGGPNLDVLYVTTAGGKEGEAGADGTLYRVPVGARGRTEFRSAVRL
jgi:D-xylonolactonase